MSSILTNNSAMVALQTLKQINSNLAKTQDEISTGKSVASAKDNAAIWAISKVMETDQSAFKAMQVNLNAAGAVIATARAGAEDVTRLLTEMRDLAVGAASDIQDHAKVQADIEKKMAQIESIISGTQLNGVNLLSTDGVNGTASFQVLASLDRQVGAVPTTANQITVDSLDLEAAIVAPAPITDRASALAAIEEVEALIEVAVSGSAALGSAAKRIEDQSSFVSKLADSLTVGIGALVDADMEAASARLQALQTQQQLGIQALSIANQAPSSILALFRN